MSYDKVKDESGEVYEVEIMNDVSDNLDHIAKYTLKAGPKVFKVVNVWEIKKKTDNPYIISFWTLEKEKEKEGILVRDKEREFKCRGEEAKDLQNLFKKIEDLKKSEKGDYYLLNKDSPETEIFTKTLDSLDSMESDSKEFFLDIIEGISEKANNLEEIDINLIKDSKAFKIESILREKRIQSKVKELKSKVKTGENEQDFQEILENNPWFFGNNYMRRVDKRNLTRDEEIDILLETVDGYYDIIELKTPEKGVIIEEEGRNSFKPHSDLSQAIGQAQTYIKWIDSDRSNIRDRDDINLLKSRCTIVIGSSLSDSEKNHLRTLNSHLNRIRILTFDDLIKMGERILQMDSEFKEF